MRKNKVEKGDERMSPYTNEPDTIAGSKYNKKLAETIIEKLIKQNNKVRT